MGEVREENQRLKIYLSQIMKDYQILQMQYNNIVKQEAAKKSTDNISTNNHQEIKETDLISLTLGSFSGNPKVNNSKDENNKRLSNMMSTKENIEQPDDEGLSLGLDQYKYERSKSGTETDQGGPVVSNPSAGSSFEEPINKEEAGETWTPSKVLKSTTVKRSVEDEVPQQNPIKKARVCVRARCDTPTVSLYIHFI